MIPTIEHYLVVSAILFVTGAIGVLMRRNALIMLMCLELMINAVNTAPPVRKVRYRNRLKTTNSSLKGYSRLNSIAWTGPPIAGR